MRRWSDKIGAIWRSSRPRTQLKARAPPECRRRPIATGIRRKRLANAAGEAPRDGKPCGTRKNRNAGRESATRTETPRSSQGGDKEFFRQAARKSLADDPRAGFQAGPMDHFPAAAAAAPADVLAGAPAAGTPAPCGPLALSRSGDSAVGPLEATTPARPRGMPRRSSNGARSPGGTHGRTL